MPCFGRGQREPGVADGDADQPPGRGRRGAGRPTPAGTGITASYADGVLSLSGSDTVAHYQQVLRTLTYDNSSENPTDHRPRDSPWWPTTGRPTATRARPRSRSARSTTRRCWTWTPTTAPGQSGADFANTWTENGGPVADRRRRCGAFGRGQREPGVADGDADQPAGRGRRGAGRGHQRHEHHGQLRGWRADASPAATPGPLPAGAPHADLRQQLGESHHHRPRDHRGGQRRGGRQQPGHHHADDQRASTTPRCWTWTRTTAPGQSGADFANTWTENGGPVAIADADAVLSDVDSANLVSLTVTLTNRLDGAAEVLAGRHQRHEDHGQLRGWRADASPAATPWPTTSRCSAR